MRQRFPPYDFAGIGHPRRGSQPGELHLDAKRWNRPVAAPRTIPLADVDHDWRVSNVADQHGPSMSRARDQPAIREPS
jgi:hypothetical protein